MPNLEEIWDESSYLTGGRNFLPISTAAYRLGTVEEQNISDFVWPEGVAPMKEFPEIDGMQEVPFSWEMVKGVADTATTEQLLGLLSVKFDDGYRHGWKAVNEAGADGTPGSELVWCDMWPTQRVEVVTECDPETGEVISQTKNVYDQHHGGGLYYTVLNGEAKSSVQLATEHTPPEAFRNALLQGLHRFFQGTCYLRDDGSAVERDDGVSVTPINVTSPE